MAYDFITDYTKEQRAATLSLRNDLSSRLDGVTWDTTALDKLKKLALDTTHMIIDEPQINADDREYSLSVNPLDASKQINISNEPTEDESYPSFFPEGDKIAFERSDTNNITQVWTMKTDGSEKTQLTTTPLKKRFPHVSPDGTFIIYTRPVNNLQVFNNIYKLELATGIETKITHGGVDSSDGIVHYFPKISPDGTQIAYQTDEYSPYFQLAIINIDGTGQTRVTNRLGDDEAPEWNPEGNKLVFSSGFSGSSQIWTVNTDGTGITQVTNTTGQEAYPSWSVNGKRLAFCSDRHTDTFYMEIVTMDLNGANLIRLTDTDGEESNPRYSPDGMHIAMDSYRGGNYSQIYIMPADGVPVHPEYRHEFLMNNSELYFAIWSYENAESYKTLADASDTLTALVKEARKEYTYRETDPVIVDRSLLRHNYRAAREGEGELGPVVGKRAPAPGT